MKRNKDQIYDSNILSPSPAPNRRRNNLGQSAETEKTESSSVPSPEIRSTYSRHIAEENTDENASYIASLRIPSYSVISGDQGFKNNNYSAMPLMYQTPYVSRMALIFPRFFRIWKHKGYFGTQMTLMFSECP